MGYVTFSLGCYMVCCSVASLAVGYIYLSCSHLYSFASYDRPYALKMMSDVEDVTPANTDFPSSDVLLPSLPKKPLPQSLEASVPIQSSESSSDIASAFSLFRDYFDKKLGALKRDIQDELCSNTDSVAKKLKKNPRSRLDSKVIMKKQFQFNSDLAEKVKSASVALGKRKLDLVKTHLEELDSDIKKRNKLIRLADKSAAGWDLVNEYLSDELASGSEDEKRIRRAELRGPFVNTTNANRKRSHPSKVIHNSNHLPQPPRLLANIHHPPDLFLVLLALSANQDQVIFVSPAASRVIGDLSVKLILKPDLQARGSPFLVLLVFRALEVNRTTELKTCSPRLDISFSQFIWSISGKGTLVH